MPTSVGSKSPRRAAEPGDRPWILVMASLPLAGDGSMAGEWPLLLKLPNCSFLAGGGGGSSWFDHGLSPLLTPLPLSKPWPLAWLCAKARAARSSFTVSCSRSFSRTRWASRARPWASSASSALVYRSFRSRYVLLTVSCHFLCSLARPPHQTYCCACRSCARRFSVRSSAVPAYGQ